jgi:hypothetical protein
VDDEDDDLQNVAPAKATHILELSDGSDDEGGDKEDDKEPEESAEAQLGQSLP